MVAATAKPALAFEVASEPTAVVTPDRGLDGPLPPWLILEPTPLGIAVAALGWCPPAEAGPRFARATFFPLAKVQGLERPAFVLDFEDKAGPQAPDTSAWPVIGVLESRTVEAARARLLPTLANPIAFAALPWVPGPRIWEALARPSAAVISRLPFPCVDLTGGALQRGLPSFPSPRFQQACAELFDVLLQQDCRAVLLSGPAGAGKSALLRYLAARIVAGEAPARLRGTRLLLLEPGAFEPTRNPEADQQRHQALTALASLDCILAVDEAQRLAAGHNQQSDALDHLKLLVTEHRARAILCTNEAHRLTGRDPALDRRLTPVVLPEADAVELREGILPQRACRAAERRGVQLGTETLHAVQGYASLLGRHAQPHASVALLDRCVARAERDGMTVVPPALVAEVASAMAGRDPAAPAEAGA
ncbi:MAG: ATP-binding protein, partial [Pseudomonadota bacterium]